jgi:mono/diheme cytochrome c family protein
MRQRLLVLCAVVALIVAGASCLGRHSPSGFRLPPGDLEAGKAAFVDLKCTSCHTVDGVTLPPPTAKVPVVLGGRKALPPTDGDLTTDIIIPSSHFAVGYSAADVQNGANSRMPDFTRTMTVRQLADLVAFLQSRYGGSWRPEGPRS